MNNGLDNNTNSTSVFVLQLAKEAYMCRIYSPFYVICSHIYASFHGIGLNLSTFYAVKLS